MVRRTEPQMRNCALGNPWIPGSRGACHRARHSRDPLARPGMTSVYAQGRDSSARPPNAFVIWRGDRGRTFAFKEAKSHPLLSTLIETCVAFGCA
jgi:hypothetical protein